MSVFDSVAYFWRPFTGLTIKSADPLPFSTTTCRYDDSCGPPQDLAIPSVHPSGTPPISKPLPNAQNTARFKCFVKSRSIGMQFSFGCMFGRWGQRITHTPGKAAILKYLASGGN